MSITKEQIDNANQGMMAQHETEFQVLQSRLVEKGLSVDHIIDQLQHFQVAIPSWALGAGGTRFGRFSIGGEPRNLSEKIHDVGLIHALTQ
ncbi:MAG: sugar isomerase, partial [Flavobacteriaceae bacterium]